MNVFTILRIMTSFGPIFCAIPRNRNERINQTSRSYARIILAIENAFSLSVYAKRNIRPI